MQLKRQFKKAFTLIELLTVVAIIAILVGLLFPAIRVALQKADNTRAQSVVNTLGVAFRAYFTEYGRWPAQRDGATMIMDSNTVALLTGSDVATSPANGALNGNPRKLSFFEYKSTDLNSTNALVDPWRNPYYFRVDATYVNSVTNPFTSALIPQGVIVWSLGSDGSFTSGSESVTPNKDNIKSW
jgi:prepilin-type N-terminal cleavage/methylation domain-containing protein